MFQDTDLFSTAGYYKLWGGGTDHDLDLCEYNAKLLKSDLYIVMNDQIPFEEDPLRYGGNKRESGMNFWINLLQEYELPYYVIKNTEINEQRIELDNMLILWWNNQQKYISEYKR